MSVAEIVEMPTQELTQQIKDSHTKCAAHAMDAVRYAIKCGQLLEEAKKTCGKGCWGHFLRKVGIHQKQSERYRNLYLNRSEIKTYEDENGVISIRAALKLLNSKKDRLGPPEKRVTPKLSIKSVTQDISDCPSDIPLPQNDTRVVYEDDSTPTPKTNLSADDRERIDRQFDMGMTSEEIAEDTGIEAALVSSVILDIKAKTASDDSWRVEDDIDVLRDTLEAFINKHSDRWSDRDKANVQLFLKEFADGVK